MKILASGWTYMNGKKIACFSDDTLGGTIFYRIYKSGWITKSRLKVHIVSAEKPYCPKHGLIHGKKYKSCNGRDARYAVLAEGIVGRTVEPLFDKRGNRLIIKLKTKDFVRRVK